jgi:hypothetical protein
MPETHLAWEFVVHSDLLRLEDEAFVGVVVGRGYGHEMRDLGDRVNYWHR